MKDSTLAPRAWAERVRHLRVDVFDACVEVHSEWRRPRSPAVLGWALRGQWASAVRTRLCATGARDCEGCAVMDACAWPVWHDSPREDDARTPQPFWWRGLPITRDPIPGDRFLCSLLAIGGVEGTVGEMEATIERGVRAMEGLRLRSVARRSLDWSHLLDVSARRWRLEAASPIDIGEPAQSRGACPDAPELDALVRRGVGRVHALLKAFSPQVQRAGFEFPSLVDVRRLEGGLVAWTSRRLTARAPGGVPMSGWTGSLVVEGDALVGLSPLLSALGMVGVGGNTALGLGELRATPLTSR